MTRGEQCKNPMNIMDVSSITWQGQIRPTLDPDGRLATFDTNIDGIRAGSINLLSYYLHDGCGTIAEIITRYAPSIENPTNNYISFVASYCGVGANDPVILVNRAFLASLVEAIINFEQGSDICTQDEINQGVSEALQHG